MIIKDGREMKIRVSKESDAEKLIEVVKKSASESENIIVTPDEFSMTVDKEREFIKSLNENPKSNHLLAIIDNQIVGMCGLHGRNNRRRIAHVTNLGITVLKEFWGLGIGYLLIIEQIKYAKQNGITKIDLEVRVDNEPAINLYKKCGFEIEGIHRNAMNVSTGYVDNLFMGLVL
ncbi:GNAT family N-acetyltransferase [Mycoplasmatota bacterium WC44]